MNRWNPVTPLTTALAAVLLGVVLLPLVGLVVGYILIVLGMMVVLYIFYIVCMRLIRERDDLNMLQLTAAYIIVGVGYVDDVIVNLLISIFPFWDPPQEPTVSERVNRYRSDPLCNPRRRRLANQMCSLLVRYDPKHCVPEVPLRTN